MELYAVKDAYTGFADPVCFVNRPLAENSFRQLCFALPQIDSIPYKVKDISLYFIGEFDSSSGMLLSAAPTLVLDGASFSKEGVDINVEISQESCSD